MIYPFIYTRTKYHDYRVVTSDLLKGLSATVIKTGIDVARAMIDADNSQLESPSWVLFRKSSCTLWGMAIVNKSLGSKYMDKCNRPVRGFFGLIFDEKVDSLPYDTVFFKQLYNLYVAPIWESLQQDAQVNTALTNLNYNVGRVITPTARLCDEINTHGGRSRLFSANHDSTFLIEMVLSSSSDISIATNIHNRSQGIAFGRSRNSFNNIVMSEESALNEIIDVEIDTESDAQTEHDNTFETQSAKTVEGQLLEKASAGISPVRKYILYGCTVIIMLMLIAIGICVFKSKRAPAAKDNIESQQ